MSDLTKLTLVLTRNTLYDFTSIHNIDEVENLKNTVVISEPYNVHFTNLDQSIVQEAMIQEVIEQMEKAELKHEEDVKRNNEKLNELRALSAPVENTYD
jgi:hypothetical protein